LADFCVFADAEAKAAATAAAFAFYAAQLKLN